MTEQQVEAGAKAAFEFDWPKDKWDRIGAGHHQDRYRGMIRAALNAAQVDGREAVAAWMMARSYATGHGDTIEDLLVELEGHACDRGAKEKKA